MTTFDLAVFAVAVISGATAAVTGFGIGSLLTPLLSLQLGTGVAVAAVSLPHAAATIVRCWRLRASIDWGVLKRFGILSAAGGLGGALLYAQLGGRALTLALASLLMLTSSAGLTGWSRKWHPHGPLVWALGLLSGFFGGIAGNQGSLRSAALSAFRLSPLAFVATATATGVLVDGARMPVYLWTGGAALRPIAPTIVVAIVGVLIGTFAGERALRAMPARVFRLVVNVTIGALGVWLAWRAW